MFDTTGPRLFALPPGVDFPAALVTGLRARLSDKPPEEMARVTLLLNTGRMLRAVQEVFTAEGAGFLPRLRLLTDPAAPLAGLPPTVSPLRRRLELTQLVARLLDAQPDLAPRAAIYDLADSLATLIEEMQGEGVAPDVLAALDVSEHSAHWKRTQDFLSIIMPFFTGAEAPDAEALRRRMVEWLSARWQASPPSDPVIVAGSTGSRGTTALLMQAVARLPQGGLVLPGFDFDQPETVWDGLADALTAEDHPQYRYKRLFAALGVGPDSVRPWVEIAPPAPARNRLVSLSLRPAPVTDQWLAEGQRLPDLRLAAAEMTLVEAPNPRSEALAIALILRDAAERDEAIALITPDRMLTRQVTAALDRWGILPDDSAGRPLALSAPGRLLRHISALFGRKLTSVALLTLLKHPLAATGAARGDHLRHTRDLELRLRRHGPAFPTVPDLTAWAGTEAEPGAAEWAGWLARLLDGVEAVGARPLSEHVSHHLGLAEALAAGPGSGGSGELWLKPAGEAAWAAMEELQREAPHGGTLTPADYDDLFTAILNAGEVREAVQGHPLIRFLGPREARECRAGRVILGGLNDGIWPQLPPPDPWLNRQMRKQAGLLLPERQVGLSAHDYQQAVAAREVILTRAVRNAEAETVPSRWVNRLMNLMTGLPDQHGPEAVESMKARGRAWLELVRGLERPDATVAPATRPAPRPPVAARPTELPVTGISRLIRDPYAIYARYILRLRKLDPLRHSPDALARGSILHEILERFIRERGPETDEQARARLLGIADAVLAKEAPWPAARALWRARLERAAPAFLAREAASGGRPVMIETRGAISLPGLGFTLTAKPDRIDELPDGRLHILDYKTGAPPTGKQQAQFDKQLLLEAAMAEKAAFETLGPREVARISYVGLNAAAKVETTEITAEIVTQVWTDLHRLIGRYMMREQGYVARRAVFEDRIAGDYDHLARLGEWDMTDRPLPEDVG